MRPESALTGRSGELGALWQRWSAAATGLGGLLLLDGDAGVGKTALARALRARVEEEATVVWVPCAERLLPPPQGVVRHIVDALDQGEPVAVAAGDADAKIVAASDAFVAALHAGVRRPLLVVVDDVQWADEVSLRVLALAAPRLGELPVLFLATLRTHELLTNDVRRSVAALLRAGDRLPVLPLTPDASRVVAQSASPRPLAPRLLAMVEARAAGNPLFLRELAMLASADPDGLQVRLSLPDTVRSVVDRRLRGLDEARAVLEQLALCGDDLPWGVVRTALGMRTEVLLRATSAAVDARVIDPPAAGRLRFTHPLVRDALVASVPYAKRVRLHQLIGRRLEAFLAAGGELDAAVVAAHLCEAAPAGGADAAATWAVRAAEEASARLAHGAAAAWYERALGAADLGSTRADRVELLLRLGAALEVAGERQRSVQVFENAYEAAREAGDPDAMARAALGASGGTGFEVAVGSRTALRLLDSALLGLGEAAPSLRARLLARRSVVGALLEPVDRREEAARRSLDLAREAGDVGAQCAALAAWCDAIAGPADAEKRLELALRIATLAREENDPKSLLLALRLAAVAHLERGDTGSFDVVVDEYEAVADRLREPSYDWFVPLWRGMRRAMTGDVRGALEASDQAEALGIAAGSANSTILVTCLRSFLAVDTGAREDLELPDATGVASMIEPWERIVTAYIAVARDDLALAREVVADLPRLLDQLPQDSEYLASLAQASKIVVAVGDGPLASLLYDRLLSHRDRFVVEGIAAYSHGSVERFLAMLAGVLGMPERDVHCARARESHLAAGAHLLVRIVDAENEPARGARQAAAGTGAFVRDGDIWVLEFNGREVRLRDAKGLRDLEVLLCRPREQVAAVDLAGRAVSRDGRGAPVLDDRARREYRARLAELDAELADAEAANDIGRAARAAAERDVFVGELTKALGLHGRPRRAGDEVERARSAVTARIRETIRRIAAAHPDLGEHLRRSVRTGTFCSYDPPVDVAWHLTSH